MSYSQGGLIAAADYNTFVGTSPSSTTNTINTVWAVGSGSAGYGQTALSQVSASSTVTAAQWASLINTLNSILTHQAGAGSGISAPTAGTTINYLSTLSGNITTAYTNRLNFSSNAAVVIGANVGATVWTVANTASTASRAFGARAAFASADQARYFFNAGGRLKLNITGNTNVSTSARSKAVVALCTDLGGIATFGANTNGGHTGSAGTYTTSNTAVGYHTSTYNANVLLANVTSVTASYTSDYASITVSTNGTQGSNNDHGTNVDFWVTLNSTSGANAGGLSINDDIGVFVARSIDVSYPETTNLSNTWGAVTITSL